MPELPEVENVRTSLHKLGFVGQKFTRVELLRAGLRVPFPRHLSQRLERQTIQAIHRRAKYLLFETDHYFLLSHLGMTGSWRPQTAPTLEKHDHLVLHFASGLKMVFNDPRRFGVLDLFAKADLEKNRWLKHLGTEPLSPEFVGDFLFARTRKLKGNIKAFLMDQRRVVGVGNIYASEALYAAGVRPSRAAGRVSRNEAQRLVESIRAILSAAIEAGGSTIRDYRNAEGEDGRFQARFRVYDKAKSPCAVCGTLIRSKFIAGRNTFWCPKCQR